MEKKDIYQTLKLINGSTCTVEIMRGLHICRANAELAKYNSQHPEAILDVAAFLLAETCLIDGERKKYDYYLEMLIDDYYQIMEAVSNQCSTFFKI